MDDYIPISLLNDFIFCPYSIYLHNIYMETDEGLYHASPQTLGKVAHETVDNKKYSTKQSDLISFPVYSDKLKLAGVIDIYKIKEKLLIERKYALRKIYRGQLYQIWAQYFCLTEMGYLVDALAFYEISTNKVIAIDKPREKEWKELISFIEKFLNYSPESDLQINDNKCMHCIYSNLCDKSVQENVYG